MRTRTKVLLHAVALLLAVLGLAAAAAAQEAERKLNIYEKELLVMSAPKGSTVRLDPGGDIWEHELLVGLAPAGATIALPRTEDAYGLELLEALAKDRGLAVKIDLGGRDRRERPRRGKKGREEDPDD